ncbi:MAG TPA: hypothetical protein VFW02_07835 [Candidatus Limnocylindrales bacterium]|nr:hypothetical protein [Candidatus Limnocylindrales bacterium]
MSRGAALSGALLITLATPVTWPLALAVFFLRGGLLLVVLPIVVLPSPVGLGNLLAPTLISVVLRGPSIEVAVLVGSVMVAMLAWIVVGGLAAATLEAEASRLVARDEDPPEPARRLSPDEPGVEARHHQVAARILAARLVAHLPTGLALIWGSTRLVAVAYRELTSPLDVTSPIVLRVLLGAPEVVIAIVVLWMVGEIIGGLAARRIALGAMGVGGALRDSVLALVRRPAGVLVDFWAPTAGLVLVLLPSSAAASAAWDLVRAAMRSQGGAFGATLAVVLFVSIWLVGLLLIAVTAAWRSAVWSVSHRHLWARGAGPAGSEPG